MSALNRWNILIVEQKPDILSLAEQMHIGSENRYNVEKASDYDSAALLLSSRIYDLVLIDVAGVHDFELLKIAVGRKFKTMVLTREVVDTADMSRAYRMGAVAYLPKSLLLMSIQFSEDVLKYGKMKAWQKLINRLKMSDVHRCNPLETYMIHCMADFFIE